MTPTRTSPLSTGTEDSGLELAGTEVVPNEAEAGAGTEPPDVIDQELDGSADASVTSGADPVDASVLVDAAAEAAVPTNALKPDDARAPVDAAEPVNMEPGVCAKLDVLFIVDNSQAASLMQERLLSSLPGFIAGIEKRLGTTDYHLMVVDSDAASVAEFATLVDVLEGNLSCEPEATCCRDHCVLSSIPFVNLLVSSCNQQPCSEVFASAGSCEGALGVGHSQNSDGDSCGFTGARRYLKPGQPDPSQALTCAAQVGTSGVQRAEPAAALVAALSPWHTGQGGCNEGFLRRDAALAVVLLSAEDDSESPGDPRQWRESVIDVKGDEQAVVVLGLVGDENIPGGLPGGQCPGIFGGAPRLQQFVSSFESGILASACAPDYGPALTETIESVADACGRLPQTGSNP